LRLFENLIICVAPEAAAVQVCHLSGAEETPFMTEVNLKAMSLISCVCSFAHLIAAIEKM
jgi:hypothetical protein